MFCLFHSNKQHISAPLSLSNETGLITNVSDLEQLHGCPYAQLVLTLDSVTCPTHSRWKKQGININILQLTNPT